MILNTPESIIEKACNEILSDKLIDESTRVSARRPIFRQVCGYDEDGERLFLLGMEYLCSEYGNCNDNCRFL